MPRVQKTTLDFPGAGIRGTCEAADLGTSD